MEPKVSNKTELIYRLESNATRIRSFGIHRISIFGSFAHNTNIHSSSDVDFILDFSPGKKTFDNLVDLGDFLEELLGRKVELLTRESLKSSTGKYILSTAQDILI